MADIVIPPEVVEAGGKALFSESKHRHLSWHDDLSEFDRETFTDKARAAITAALSAWPGMRRDYWDGDWSAILPLPQEAGDDR